MITAEEAKRITDDAKLKKKSEAEANTNCYLSTLYGIIKDTADKGQYARTIPLGTEIDKGIYLMTNGSDTIPISLEYLEKELHNDGYCVKVLRSNYGLGDYITISWGK